MLCYVMLYPIAGGVVVDVRPRSLRAFCCRSGWVSVNAVSRRGRGTGIPGLRLEQGRGHLGNVIITTGVQKERGRGGEGRRVD